MNTRRILEVCANSVESALLAQEGGASRVELCDNLYEGGTTPSYGKIYQARKNLHIDLNILIRPRGGDFYYSDIEFEIMQKDILTAKKLGANGVVLGLLHPNGTIDKVRTKILVKLASPMSVTFHRAYDMSNDRFQSLEDIIECNCNRILTSGQHNNAYEGRKQLQELIKQAENRIIIMPGGGITEDNIAEIAKVSRAKEFHASLREYTDSKMNYHKKEIYMNGLAQIPEFKKSLTDLNRVKKVIEILSKIEKPSR